MFLAWCDTKNQNVHRTYTHSRSHQHRTRDDPSYECNCGELGQMATGAATAQIVSGHTTPTTPASEAPTAA